MKTASFRLIGGMLACSIAAASFADIIYKVKLQPDATSLQVEMLIPVKGDSVAFSMPNWSPGAYMMSKPAKQIKDMVVVDKSGATLLPIGETDNTWTVSGVKGGSITVKYSVPAQANDGAYHFSGPSTYLYVVGRKTEPSSVTVNVPSGWQVFTGLDAAKGKTNTFVAPDYDVLADNPVSTGDPSTSLIAQSYTVSGTPHQIVLMGEARKLVDLSKIKELCSHISTAQRDFFGGLPYRKYVWHFFVSDSKDGGWGLEHLSSTEIGLASGIGPGVTSVLSHEFFHLWNVKRIRSKPLGPFDYDVLPKTGALWWLEGVTDYYADYLLYRYQWFPADSMYKSIADNWRAVYTNAAFKQVSAYEASYRVGDAAGGQGNSQGFNISYYNLGWLAGLCLDIEIRANTGGKRSLDDVTKALYDLTKDGKPGFAEDEIRTQCIRFGGPSMGPFYDQVVMKAGEMPVAEQLLKVGLSLKETEEPYVDLGMSAFPSRNDKGARVRVVGPGSALKEGDIITSIDGSSLEAASASAIADALSAALAKAKAGTVMKFEIRRGSETMSVDVTPVDSKRKVFSVTEMPDATAAQLSLRNGWLATKPKPKV